SARHIDGALRRFFPQAIEEGFFQGVQPIHCRVKFILNIGRTRQWDAMSSEKPFGFQLLDPNQASTLRRDVSEQSQPTWATSLRKVSGKHPMPCPFEQSNGASVVSRNVQHFQFQASVLDYFSLAKQPIHATWLACLRAIFLPVGHGSIWEDAAG